MKDGPIGMPLLLNGNTDKPPCILSYVMRGSNIRWFQTAQSLYSAGSARKQFCNANFIVCNLNYVWFFVDTTRRTADLVKSPEFLSPCPDFPAIMLSGHLSCSRQQLSVSLNSPRSSALFERLPTPHHFVPGTRSFSLVVSLCLNLQSWWWRQCVPPKRNLPVHKALQRWRPISTSLPQCESEISYILKLVSTFFLKFSLTNHLTIGRYIT